MARQCATTIQRGVQVYCGTMTFDWSQASSVVDDNVATKILEKFKAANGIRVDAARIYAGGLSEEMLGRALAQVDHDNNFVVGTKAHPSQPHGLSAKGLRKQLQDSLDAMQINKVDEYYLHQPDTEVALTESLATADALVREGRIGKIGMSNYHAVEVERAFELCDKHGWHRPAVYQGLYNPLNRAVEEKLLPVLRANGAAFVAYNPLAAGLLTGKHGTNASAAPMHGRFKDNPNYLPRFFTPANFEAVNAIRDAVEGAPGTMTMAEAVYRWLRHGSALDGAHGDGVLVGASSVAHIESNIAACAIDEALPPSVQAAMDAAYLTVSSASEIFPYWRSYSADHPLRETLDQGASYSAGKK